MDFFSCDMIVANYLNINGRIDNGGNPLTLCCEPIENKPSSGFKDTPRETLESFLGMRNIAILESSTGGSRRSVTSACVNCANFRKLNPNICFPITYVNLSMYPAPCQCRCIYCEVTKKYVETPEVKEAYDKLFDMLEYAVQSGAILPNARWQVSTGEITIHPYHDRIMKLIGSNAATFYTNAFVFDEDIAKKMKTNPAVAIDLSIDSGTAETWEKIKGFDNFDKVVSNLEKYSKSSMREGQIVLKYIILPGINDNLDDFKGLMKIIKRLKVSHLTLARDTRKKYDCEDEEYVKLMGAAAYLNAYCTKNKITTDMFSYKPEERELITEQSMEVIANGMIDS